jgi:heme exporter protein C
VGVVNVPIIYFSVNWWNTLHQGASVSLSGGSSMAADMLQGMLVMTLAAWCYCIATALHRVRSVILEREGHSNWVRRLMDTPGPARTVQGGGSRP